MSAPDRVKLLPAIAKLPHPMPILTSLMLLAGLRISETLTLKWVDLVYLDKPLIAIRLKPEHCKFRQPRVVPISPLLHQHISALWPIPLTNFGVTHDDYVAAPGHAKPAITARTLQRHLATASQQSIGYHVNPHMFRHTFATELRRVADVTVVQQALGHKRLSTTARYMTPGLDEQAQAIANMFRT